MLLDYISQGSKRAESPMLEKCTAWIFTEPGSGVPDPEIIQVFISIFRHHVASKFLIFDQNQSDYSAPPDALGLAMAAVGGVHCHTPGAYSVAKALFSDARRLILTAVGGPKLPFRYPIFMAANNCLLKMIGP